MRLLLAIAVVIAIVVGTVILSGQTAECQKRHGEMVRTAIWYACVRAA